MLFALLVCGLGLGATVGIRISNAFGINIALFF